MAETRRDRVTLAALLALLQPTDRVFIVQRLAPYECEGVAGGTVRGLRSTRCAEVCGEDIVERFALDVDDWLDVAASVLVVTIGRNPCQDLSVAGRRAGLAGEQSGLFIEQIRIIKEMREADVRRGRADQFIRPRFMVWENVPGAFSSNKGKDFRAVLEETIRVAEPDAPDVPLPPKGKWPLADC